MRPVSYIALAIALVIVLVASNSNMLTVTSIKTTGGNGLRGDATIVAGANVALSQNDATTTITVAVPTSTEMVVKALQLGGGVLPTCDAASRGQFWYVPGGAGVADTVSVCAKDNTDVYDWRTIY